LLGLRDCDAEHLPSRQGLAGRIVVRYVTGAFALFVLAADHDLERSVGLPLTARLFAKDESSWLRFIRPQ
jgi:hypothetical protein